jgi:glycosyltransferase involved in cell wall biosynthesis
MQMASVVVYPYLNSTQSGSLQVAYSFGRPVIATNVGGLPDAVEDGKSGFLVDPNNPEQLADKILLFINKPELTKSMGAYAKHLSETRFSWKTVAKIILDALENSKKEN